MGSKIMVTFGKPCNIQLSRAWIAYPVRFSLLEFGVGFVVLQFQELNNNGTFNATKT